MLMTGLALLALSGSSPLLASTPLMVPTVHIFDEKKWKAEQRELRKKFTPICRKIVRNRDALEVVVDDPSLSNSDISQAADYLLGGDHSCPRDPALAVRLLDSMIAPAPFTLPRAYLEQLVQFSIAESSR